MSIEVLRLACVMMLMFGMCVVEVSVRIFTLSETARSRGHLAYMGAVVVVYAVAIWVKPGFA